MTEVAKQSARGVKTNRLAQPNATPEIIKISWFKSHENKVRAGDKKFRYYKDQETGEMVALIDPSTGKEKPFTVFAYKDFELDVRNNKWHKAVYEFIKGKTIDGGPWRGHPSFNPKLKMLSLVNVTLESKKNRLTRIEIRELEMKLEAMPLDRLMLFGSLFGTNGKNMGYDDVLDVLVEIVKTPDNTVGMFYTQKDIKSKLSSADLDYYLVVSAMINAQTLVFKGDVYKYGDEPVGIDIDAVVRWMKDNPNIYSSQKSKYLKDDLAGDSGSNK